MLSNRISLRRKRNQDQKSMRYWMAWYNEHKCRVIELPQSWSHGILWIIGHEIQMHSHVRNSNSSLPIEIDYFLLRSPATLPNLISPIIFKIHCTKYITVYKRRISDSCNTYDGVLCEIICLKPQRAPFRRCHGRG